MLYAVLRFMADDASDEEGGKAWVTRATYDELGNAAGLSRTMGHAALRLGGRQADHIRRLPPEAGLPFAWYEKDEKGGWFKLPCLAITSANRVQPFLNFKLVQARVACDEAFLATATADASSLPSWTP